MDLNEWGEQTGPAPELSVERMETLINEYNSAWDEYQAKKKVATEAHEEFQQIEHEIIKCLQGAQKTKYASEIGTVTLAVAATVKVPATIEEKRAFFNYLKEMSEDTMLGMATVNSNTLNSWYKKMKEDSGYAPGFSLPGIGPESERVVLKFTGIKK